MGNNVDNKFNFGDFIKGWAGICYRSNGILPFIGQTLWQVGPPPWMLMMNTTSIWPSSNMGEVGDWFNPTGNNNNSTKNKFNKLEKVLKDYAATLTGSDKTILEDKLKDFENLKSSEKNQEKYDELLEIFEDYKSKIKESKLAFAGLSKKDSEPLADLSFENLKSKLENNDIVDIIDAWNTNESTKGTKLLSKLQEKIGNSTGTENTDYKMIVDKLHEKLKNKAESLEDDSNLSSDNKKALKNAIDTFIEFQESRYTNTEYVKAFDNLYMASRLAEAEIAQKELKEEFKFLGEDSPFDEADFVSETQRDLRSEGLRKAQTVTVPEEDDPSDKPAEKPQDKENMSIKINAVEYEVIEEDSERKYKNKTTGKTLTEEEFFNETNVTDVVINEDGSYTFKAGGVKYKGTPDHVVSRDA